MRRFLGDSLSVMIHTASSATKRTATINVKIFTVALQLRSARRFSHTQHYNARFSRHDHDVSRLPGRFAESASPRICAIHRAFRGARGAACPLLCPERMFRSSSSWLRVLLLYVVY